MLVFLSPKKSGKSKIIIVDGKNFKRSILGTIKEEEKPTKVEKRSPSLLDLPSEPSALDLPEDQQIKEAEKYRLKFKQALENTLAVANDEE